MARQLMLKLERAAPLDRAHYVVAGANAAAVSAVMAWPGWPGGRMALTGPAGSGKTHLAHVWAEAAASQVLPAGDLTVAAVPELAAAPLALDDAAGVAGRPEAERALFHLLNHMRETGQPLLLTARDAPARWPVALPDLASRLATLAVTEIPAPDDRLLAAVFEKVLADRLVRAEPAVIAYLVTRSERSFAAARALAHRLADSALTEKRELRLPLVREIIAALERRDDLGQDRDL